MNNIIKRTWNQNRMVNIEDLRGMAFQAESGGHTFEISGIDDTGAAVTLSGTVSGVFRRPDNADIALTGSASDGVASVTLSEDCYAVPGRFWLTIFVTSNSQKVAVYACVGTVAVSSTGNVAGDTPASVEDLIDDINAAITDLNTAIGSIPADYSQFMAAIAPAYSSSALYAVGSYAWYNGSIYRCTTAITTAETWTAAHWTVAVIGNDVSDLKSAINDHTSQIYSIGTELIGEIQTANTRYYDLWQAPKQGSVLTFKNVGTINGILGATKQNGTFQNLIAFTSSVKEGTYTFNEQFKSIGFYGYQTGTAKIAVTGANFDMISENIIKNVDDETFPKISELSGDIYDLSVIKSANIEEAGVRIYDLWLPPAQGTYIVENIGTGSFIFGGIKSNGGTVDLAVFSGSRPKTQTINITNELKSIGVYAYAVGNVSLKILGAVYSQLDKLAGKKAMFFGDSITADENRYRKWLLLNTGMQLVESFAVSGATLTNSDTTTMDGNPTYSSNNTVPNQVQKLLNGTYETVPDVVIVSAAVNDPYAKFNGGLNESQFTDSAHAYTDVDTCDLKTPSGAMRWIYEKIMTLYPSAQVFFATPIQCGVGLQYYGALKIKRDTIVEIANRMSLCVIDAFNKSGIYGRYEQKDVNGKYLADGLHPNVAGGKLLAKCYEDEIRSNLHYVESST